MNFTVKDILSICHATLLCGDENTICSSFTKDTREIKEGDTYIGIKGENFDGSSFYQDAFAKGANAIILEKEYVTNNSIAKEDKPIIVVDNSLIALKLLAETKRNNSKAKFVGVTGSVGKTSTRDMIYSVLNTHYKTLKTEGNFNNNIGLPLTLLRLQDEEAAVIEMGMNHLGEIDYLTKITHPHISVITNVGTAHIGELGSRENILKAKLEIINGMDKDGILVINNDNDMLHTYYETHKDNVITIGIDNPSDFMAANINLMENYSTFTITYHDEKYDVKCPVPGKVFIYNSLIAFAVGTLMSVPASKIINGILNISLTKNRMEFISVHDMTFINDAYNASVDSMKSSLEILGRYPTRKIAVLGDMLELGTYSKTLHEEVGTAVFQNNIDILLTVGKEATHIANKAQELGMKKEQIIICPDNNTATKELTNILKPHDTVLFKASNGMKFKEIVNDLQNFYH